MSKKNDIIFHQIRNCTTKLTYAGVNILIDPFLVPKGFYPGLDIAPTPEQKKIRVPMNDLPISINEILKGIQAVIITHTHIDHWDDYAVKYIPKNTPIFVQNPGDKQLISSQGFTDVRVVGVNTPFKGITITKIPGQHGNDEMISNPINAEGCGDSMQFVLKSPGQKTFYVSGDTVWNELVELALNKYKPDIIVLNAAETAYEGIKGSSIMEANDIKTCYKLCKDAKILITHLNSYPHNKYTIETMKIFVEENNMKDRVIVPEDGEIIKF